MRPTSFQIAHALASRLFAVLLFATLLACSPHPEDPGLAKLGAAPAEDSLAAETAAQALQESGTTALPRQRDYDWMSLDQWQRLHDEDAAIAAKGGIDLLFLGDSITEGWDAEVWETHFASYAAANFGIGGDHTGNLLWRLQNGAAGTLQPKVVVLMVGVNNFIHLNETPEQVFAGVNAVVNTLQAVFPTAQILLNGVFPYGQSPDTPEREQVENLNFLLQTLGERPLVHFQDHGHLLLESDGRISTEIMGDYLHLTTKGYQIWAEAILPSLYLWLNPEAVDATP